MEEAPNGAPLIWVTLVEEPLYFELHSALAP